MDVNRLLSLIPDRAVRTLSGSVFTPSEAAASRYPERMAYLGKFLHWLGPLEPMSREEQQILGVRAAPARPAGEEALEGALEMDADDELEELESAPLVETGTPIAQPSQPSMVGG